MIGHHHPADLRAGGGDEIGGLGEAEVYEGGTNGSDNRFVGLWGEWDFHAFLRMLKVKVK
jgi:hypothetical protein